MVAIGVGFYLDLVEIEPNHGFGHSSHEDG